MNYKNIFNKKFGRLIVLAQSGRKSLVKCDCGKQKFIYTHSLKTGQTKSCGCLRKELRKEKASKLTNSLSPSWKGCGEIPGKYFIN